MIINISKAKGGGRKIAGSKIKSRLPANNEPMTVGESRMMAAASGFAFTFQPKKIIEIIEAMKINPLLKWAGRSVNGIVISKVQGGFTKTQ